MNNNAKSGERLSAIFNQQLSNIARSILAPLSLVVASASASAGPLPLKIDSLLGDQNFYFDLSGVSAGVGRYDAQGSLWPLDSNGNLPVDPNGQPTLVYFTQANIFLDTFASKVSIQILALNYAGVFQPKYSGLFDFAVAPNNPAGYIVSFNGSPIASMFAGDWGIEIYNQVPALFIETVPASSVPEPATFGLMGVSLLIMAAARRKSSNNPLKKEKGTIT